MEETLRQLRPYIPSTFDELSADWGRQKILERAMQVLVETMIDIGERIVARSGLGPCETSAEVMQRLVIVQSPVIPAKAGIHPVFWMPDRVRHDETSRVL